MKYNFDILKGFGTFPPLVPEKQKKKQRHQQNNTSDSDDENSSALDDKQKGNFSDKTNDLIALGLIMFMLIVLTFTLTFVGVKYFQ